MRIGKFAWNTVNGKKKQYWGYWCESCKTAHRSDTSHGIRHMKSKKQVVKY